MLRKELEIKNKQIEDLNARLAEVSSALVMAQQTAQAAQALHAGTIQQQFLREPPIRLRSNRRNPKREAGSVGSLENRIERLIIICFCFIASYFGE